MSIFLLVIVVPILLTSLIVARATDRSVPQFLVDFIGRCPRCHSWWCGEGKGFSFAGESIFNEAWCKHCSQPLGILPGGYITYRTKADVQQELDNKASAFGARRTRASLTADPLFVAALADLDKEFPVDADTR